MPYIPGPGLPSRRPRKRSIGGIGPVPKPRSVGGLDAMGGTPRLSRGHRDAMKHIKPSTGQGLGGRGYGSIGSGPIAGPAPAPSVPLTRGKAPKAPSPRRSASFGGRSPGWTEEF